MGPHPHHVEKKPVVFDDYTPAGVPSVVSLFTASAGLPTQPSPGALHGNRVAAVVRERRSRPCHRGQRACKATNSDRPPTTHDHPRTQPLPSPDSFAAVFATGAAVYWHSARLAAPLDLLVGKESLMLPARTAAAPAARLHALRHAGEVQSVALRPDGAGFVLATADSYGQGTLSRFEVDLDGAAAVAGAGQQQDMQPPAAAPRLVGMERLEPRDPLREGGWAGVAFSHARPSLLACARACARDVSLFDGAALARTLRTATQPYAVAFLPAGAHGGGGGDVLAAAEGHIVSVFGAPSLLAWSIYDASAGPFLG
jgi:hypothetical protein